MKRFLAIAAVSTSIAGFGGGVWAADPYVDPGVDWSGFYLGVQGGYAWSDTNSTALGNLGAGTVSTGDLNPEGLLGGLYAGYNFQTNSNLVLGLEADINLADIDSGDVTITSGGVPLPGETHSGDMDWNGAARVRLGYAADRILPYVAGGLALGDYDVSIDHSGASGNLGGTVFGWTIGGGLEFAVTESFTTRAEYRYTEYEEVSGNAFAPLFPTESQNSTLKTHDIRLGLAIKF
jgi:outer membrane immunogenic protein